MQNQRRLPTGHGQINFGQNLGIQQRAVKFTMQVVYVINTQRRNIRIGLFSSVQGAFCEQKRGPRTPQCASIPAVSVQQTEFMG